MKRQSVKFIRVQDDGKGSSKAHFGVVRIDPFRQAPDVPFTHDPSQNPVKFPKLLNLQTT